MDVDKMGRPTYRAKKVTKMAQRMTKKADALVGKFYHTYKNGVLGNQGEVLARVSEGFYLVQLYEWLMGFASNQQVVSVDSMTEWKFYECREDWQHAYETYKFRADRAQGQ